MNNKRRSDTKEASQFVYSTDPIPPARCSQCRRVESECRCADALLEAPLKPVIQLERKGRGGKSVTIIKRLPPHEKFLKEICKELKNRLGTGGTSYLTDGEGVIEIQGERIEDVREFFSKRKQ